MELFATISQKTHGRFDKPNICITACIFTATKAPSAIMNVQSAPTAEFPPKAQAYLTSFYEAKRITADDTKSKIEALRKDFIKEDMLVASTEGILDDGAELRALEFYVLDSLKMLED